MYKENCLEATQLEKRNKQIKKYLEKNNIYEKS